MLDDPARVDAHVVGHHVRREPDAALPGPVAQVRPRRPRRPGRRAIAVVVERVGGRRRVRVAAPDLDPLADAFDALPQADEPEPGDAPAARAGRAPRRGWRRGSGCRARTGATSWSSQTWVLLAMRTRRGIQAESLEKRSGSASRPVRSGASPLPAAAVAAATPPPNRRWSPRSSSAMTSSVSSIRSRSAVERVAQQRAPAARGRSAAGRRATSGGRAPAPAAAPRGSRRWARWASAGRVVRLERGHRGVALLRGQRASRRRAARSGRAAGFSLAIRTSSSSSRRTGSASSSSVRELVADGVEQLVEVRARPAPRSTATAP